MKTKLLFATLLVACTALFVGCAPEQSELSIDSLKESARVSGRIVYDAGVDINSENAYMVNRTVPASERVVYVEVPYSQYGVATNESSKIFETVTDSAGFFSIDIPTIPAGINEFTVRMQEFTTIRSEYEKMENNAPVFDTKLHRYTYENKFTETLKPGTVYNVPNDKQFADYEAIEIEELDETITLKGKINIAYEKEFRQGDYNKLANATVVFTALYNIEGQGMMAFEFGTVTDAEGNYSVTLPLESYEKGFDGLSVQVKGIGQTYKHFYAVGKSVDIPGAYVGENIWYSEYGFTDIIEGMEYRMPEMFLKFTPNYNNGLTEGITPSTYVENLAGWERYDGFTQYQTVTGQVLLATETEYGIGTYSNPTQEAVVYIDYKETDPDAVRKSKEVYVNTDKDGKFSFSVPVKDMQEKLTVSIEPNQPGTEITHYLADKSITLDGKYTQKIAAIKELGAKWYDAGRMYFTFDPVLAGDIKVEWNPNLAGWYKAGADYYEYESEAEVTATINIAFESEYKKGEYKKADAVIAEFSVGGQKYAAPVANGKVSMTIYTQNETSEPYVVCTGITKYEKKFIHYTSADDVVIFTGYYDEARHEDTLDERAAWNKLGTVNVNFTPENPDYTWDPTLWK